MEERKQKEIEYYEKKATELSRDQSFTDFNKFEAQSLASFKFLYKILAEKCRDKMVLDYGCGNGIHSSSFVKMRAKRVVGIDLSEKSLTIARERAKEEGVEDGVEFLKMDCEKMDFPDNHFDIIFDGGVFSSLDIEGALPELSRVLKPEGFLVGIEPLGHNPITNLKRKINKVTGKRTKWAEEHILKQQNFEQAKKNFNKIEVHYFHLISWMAFPFLKLPGGEFLLKLLEKTDEFLLFSFPFLQKYSFRVVFILSQPKNKRNTPL